MFVSAVLKAVHYYYYYYCCEEGFFKKLNIIYFIIKLEFSTSHDSRKNPLSRIFVCHRDIVYYRALQDLWDICYIRRINNLWDLYVVYAVYIFIFDLRVYNIMEIVYYTWRIRRTGVYLTTSTRVIVNHAFGSGGVTTCIMSC